MTRSSAMRRNRNARRIAAEVLPGNVPDAPRAFDADSARRFVTTFRRYVYEGAWSPDEVNWPYCADLLNRKAKAPLRRRNVRWEQPAGEYTIHWRPNGIYGEWSDTGHYGSAPNEQIDRIIRTFRSDS